MKTVFLDTTKKQYELAVRNGEVELSYVDDGKEQTSVSLFENLQQLCGAAGFEFGRTDRFLISIGPGSFTGVRIGVAAVKGAAFGGRAEVYAIDALKLLFLKKQKGLLPIANYAVIIPDVGGFSYAAIYSGEGEELSPPDAFEADALSDLIARYSAQEIFDEGEPFDFDYVDHFTKVELANLSPLYIRKSQAENALGEKQRDS